MKLDKLKNLVLSQTQLKSLVVVYNLYPRGKQMNELENLCQVSKNELKRVLKVLDEEVKSLHFFDKVNNIIVVKDKFVSFNSEINEATYTMLLMQLRKKYLLSSSVYKALLFVLEQRYFCLQELADHLFYSDSYTYKIIKRLKNFFYYLETDLKLVKVNKSDLYLEGRESSKIIFHYLLVMLVSHENDWVFQDSEKEVVLSYQPTKILDSLELLSDCNRDKILNLLAIYKITSHVKDPLFFLSKNIIEIGELMDNDGEFPFYINQTIDVLNDDRNLHFLFMVHYFIQELRDRNQKILVGKNYTTLEKNEIIQTCMYFLEDIKQNFSISQDCYYELLYTLCKRLVVVHHLGLHQFMFERHTVEFKGVVDRRVEVLFDKYFYGYQNERSYAKLKYSLIPLVTSYVKLAVEQPLKIYVEFQHHSEDRMIVVNALKHRYSTKILEIVESYELADIIISDTPSISFKEKTYFLIRHALDPHTWCSSIVEYVNSILNTK
ncbi:helix-turn-helix domain-containing protein [Enterococcus faecalis]|uniref:helix-turn-helix domain-containing protein n=1 Tax=Enterococcus TaxID=1350 RepID=UPI001921B021|nr:helix-turn-helix domain-containing protein [Enterococcus faecalis]MCD5248692.1 helix-turn-helix domain-containing protein [Enterococcus faecalis]MDN3150218.1 helix-turn-helix domain-containing protein [Enterococcus faecalis]MDN3158029.1 helix-turn-helix domain-containing protein [Enterococcus faecalis]HBC7248594.1 helix-turn-helix domain-containing protein [Enterococcus faecalis]HCQ9317334.1 helix-turn-helix domain-containing protein [Enterococcus faecalis]